MLKTHITPSSQVIEQQIKSFNMTQNTQMLNRAKEVIQIELEGLQALNDSLDVQFCKAVEAIYSTQGRVIVSGVGKSGHIARKIAATLASTGQPSFFVHAAEAGHGDLGMITGNDILLLISYSGGAKELLPIIDFAKRLGVTIISITGKEKSILAQQSKHVLLLPSHPEACPLGLAPTTSTTLSLALGDAIAVSLLELRGLTHSDFRNFHPGGQLGFQLKPISEFVHPLNEDMAVNDNDSIQVCLEKISKGKLGCVGVFKSHQLVGVITDGDVRRFLLQKIEENQCSNDIASASASDVMTHHPLTIKHSSFIGEALQYFESKSISNLFVTNDENHTIQGIIHIHDCIKAKAI